MDLRNNEWHFNGINAEKFSSHVRESIPYYDDIHELILSLSSFFIKEESLIYDLGTSHAELIMKLGHHFQSKNIQIVGIDSSYDMCLAAQKNTDKQKQIQIINGDISSYAFQANDLTISCFTLQFLRFEQKWLTLQRVFQSLNKGGALILFEKTLSSNPQIENILNTLHFEFKLSKGLSEKEVLSKLLSLKGKMNLNTSDELISNLQQVGFHNIDRIFKANSFEGFLAIK